MRWWRRHPVSDEELSVYLDARLEQAKARRVGAHLEKCEACRVRLEELRATVHALRALPSVEVPRSFTISREAVAPAQARVAPTPLRAYRFAGALSTVALVAFLALISTDLATLGGGPEEPGRGQGAALSSSQEKAEAPPGELHAMPPAAAEATPPGEPVEGEDAAALPEEEGAEEEEMPAPQTFGAQSAQTPEARAAAPAPEAPEALEEGGADIGRWVLRGFEGMAAAVFLLALSVVVRRRWRGRQEQAGP